MRRHREQALFKDLEGSLVPQRFYVLPESATYIPMFCIGRTGNRSTAGSKAFSQYAPHRLIVLGKAFPHRDRLGLGPLLFSLHAGPSLLVEAIPTPTYGVTVPDRGCQWQLGCGALPPCFPSLESLDPSRPPQNRHDQRDPSLQYRA